METLLEVKDLQTVFRTEYGRAPAVDGVSLRLAKGRTTALVGESGCGKSVLSLSILDLIPSPGGRIERGEILLEGVPLPLGDEERMRDFRGNVISMIFQEPMTSLNPVMKVGTQVIEAIRIHQGTTERGNRKSRSDLKAEAVRQLRRVGLPDPERRLEDYPHNLSGGMRQRVMIAMAVSCQPRLLIADEPTTALDVTVQAQIMELLKNLQQKSDMSVLLITHDLALVEEQAEFVYVMYAGKIVEEGPTARLIGSPRHPYTAGLLASRPRIRAGSELTAKGVLPAIPGQVPEAIHFGSGCRFADRCPRAGERCREETPDLVSIEEGGRQACFYPLAPNENTVWNGGEDSREAG